MPSELAVRVVQVFSVLSCIGVVVAGILHLKGTAGGAGWCDTSGNIEPCWKDNYGSNTGFAMTMFGGVLIAFGAILFMVGARSEGWFPSLQPWKYFGPCLMLVGCCTLGASGNLGIILGALAMLMGLIMFLMAIISNVQYGIEPGKSTGIPQGLITFVQLMCALFSVGSMIVGLMCVISVGRASTKLQWCSADSAANRSEGDCWSTRYNSGFALACYGAAIFLFGLICFLATLRFKNWFASLYPWNVLSLFHIFTGLLSLGATGNTGIILGACHMGFGGIMLFFYVFFSVTTGTKSL